MVLLELLLFRLLQCTYQHHVRDVNTQLGPDTCPHHHHHHYNAHGWTIDTGEVPPRPASGTIHVAPSKCLGVLPTCPDRGNGTRGGPGTVGEAGDDEASTKVTGDDRACPEGREKA